MSKHAKQDSLGDRMKEYERVTRRVLPRRTYTIIRVDGRAFHTYTKGLDRPFDTRFMSDMSATAEYLCKEISGAVLAYTQSDEISILVQDFATLQTQPWLGGVEAKITSLTASLAAGYFNRARADLYEYDDAAVAAFDSRVVTLPYETEVANYFLWRQQDAVRNSLQSLARAHFSHKRLNGLKRADLHELLWSEKGINWNDLPADQKRGRFTRQEDGTRVILAPDATTTNPTLETIPITEWVTTPAPFFTTELEDAPIKYMPPRFE
jgi:tRNA(His) 5'-end guanylyltransferase